MDRGEVTVEVSDGGKLEPLVIIEEGDVVVSETETASGEVLTSSALQTEGKQFGGDKIPDRAPSGARLEERRPPTTQTLTEEHQREVPRREEDEVSRPEEVADVSEGRDGDGEARGEKTEEGEKSEGTSEEHRATERDVEHRHGLASSDETSTEAPDAPKQVHPLTLDFPEYLYELLCTLQEGRRLNDQRCSFQLKEGMTRRRCHSEPNTNKPANRVIFSSMNSLQREEFFDLVATTQARRLNDQRAELQRSLPLKPKTRSFRSSLKQLSMVKKPVPAPVPKEDLYNMIRSTQAQGRLEDQRSRAPGPMDDEDFFSLLLRVQGGRMEEQRTELPCILQT